MTYYLLPKTSFLIHKYIECIDDDKEPETVISNSLSHYLYNIKTRLDDHENEWDIFKKYTNPYEYVHTVVPFKKKSISVYKPLSRSYFKMIEILNTFNLTFGPKPIQTFHLAEGPGGFIEALCNVRKNKNDVYIGMTILDDFNDSNIPGWKKSEAFLKNNENVYIECGEDDTGNILSLANFEFCKKKYGSSMDFVTGDGGFDFSMDFNKQEISISQLLFAQVCYALVLQKKGGTFVLKLFDSFMQHTVDILYILSSFYDKVYLIKPQTSRYANSEKYVVCKDFLFSNNEQFYPFLCKTFESMLYVGENRFIHRFLNIPLSYYFLLKLEEYNSIFGQQQIENIHFTTSLIEIKQKQEKIDGLIKTNIQKCIQWCKKNGIEANNYITNNIFFSEDASQFTPLKI
jgi:23S rRNA U2552 (ribose-2'-O)-methylase RlmE/FtsJ